MFRLLVAGSSMLFAAANAQYQNYYDNWGADTLLCNSSISLANASDIFKFNVSFNDVSYQYVPDPAWAVTVDQTNNATQTSFWYDTAGQNYSDDLSIRYDVCSWIWKGLPINTVQLGQDDPGDCSSTLSLDCRNALLQRAEDSATLWTTYASPPPYSNLSAGVTSYICQKILDDLGDGTTGGFPKECQQDIGGTGLDTMFARKSDSLTGHNSSVLNDNCSLTGSADQTFHRVGTLGEDTSTQGYDDAVHNVYPALSVWFTVANVERKECCQPSRSSLSCLRARDIAAGSRVSPALAAGTPYKRKAGLSKGGIAGVVVGIVVVLAVIAIGVFLWYRRKKRSVPLATKYEHHDGDEMPQTDSTPLHELNPEDRRREMDSKPVFELSQQDRKAEMEGSSVGRHGSQKKFAELA